MAIIKSTAFWPTGHVIERTPAGWAWDIYNAL
jgi:hypothetical protein